MRRAALAGIATLLGVGIVGGLVAQQLWLASRHAIERRFAASSDATSSILSTALSEQLTQIDAVARALEASPPGENTTVATDSIYAILANHMVSGENAPFLGFGFARNVEQADAANWEAMATEAYGNQARIRFGNLNLTDGSYSPPLPYATNESAFPLEHTYPVGFFAPNAGVDLASISFERLQALRRCQNSNRLSLTGQVLGLNSRFPVAFFYAPVFVSIDPARVAGTPARIVHVPSTRGSRPATDVELVPRGVKPDPSSRKFFGVVAASTSAARLISLWKRIGGGITDVQVLMQDVTVDSQATECQDISATLASSSTILEPSNATFYKSCRNGTMLRDQALGSVNGFTASNAKSQSIAVTPDITTTAEPADPEHDVTISCTHPELVALAVADGTTVVDIRQSDFTGTSASEIAKSQLRTLCERIQGNVGSRAGTALRAQTFLDIGGRRMSVVTVAAEGFEAANGQVSEGVAALVVVLVAVICGSVVFVSMSGMAAAVRREELKQKEAEARLKVARTVHHTTVSYLAHEIRGGLSVSSIGAGLAAEGLREDGLRLTNGDVIPPDLLQPAGATPTVGLALDEADDGVFGAVSSVGLLRDLQRIQAASASSLRLIEDVLDIVGLETGKLSVKLSLLNPAHFMLSIADRYRPISAVPIRLDVGAGVPARILSDPLRCEQAVLNGLTNAIKHTKTGNIVVSLRIETIRIPKTWHRLSTKGLNFFEQAAANADSTEEDEGTDGGGATEHDENTFARLLSCCPCSRRRETQPVSTDAAVVEARPAVTNDPRVRRLSSESSTVSDLTTAIPAAITRGSVSALQPLPRHRSGRVRSRALPAQAPYLVVRIIDNGGGLQGIDPEQLLRPFVSDKKAITRGGTRVRSTGLGLPIAAQVAELIGGRVSLADDGEGHTVYTVVIPLIPPRRLVDDMEEGLAGYRVGHELWRLLETDRAGDAAALLESEAAGSRPSPAAHRSNAEEDVTEPGDLANKNSAAGMALAIPSSYVSEGSALSVETGSADVAGSSQGRPQPARMEALEEEEDCMDGDTPPNYTAGHVDGMDGIDVTAIPASTSAVGIVVSDGASLIQASPVIHTGRGLSSSSAHVTATTTATAAVDSVAGAVVSGLTATTSRGQTVAVAAVSSSPVGKRADRASRQARREQRQAERQSRREASSSRSVAATAAASASSSHTLTPKTGSFNRSLSVAGADTDTPLPEVAPGCGVLRGRGKGPLQGMFVLCVDDEPMVLASTTRLLRRLGCNVVAVQNPLEVDAILEFSGQLPPVDVTGDSTSSNSVGGRPHMPMHTSTVSGSGHGGGSGSLAPSTAATAPTGWTIGRGMAHGPSSAICREDRPDGPGIGRFTCVFMDIIMPQRDGDVIAAGLRDRGFKSPIIAITGNIAAMDIRKYSACGFNGVLGKPLDRDVLLSLLETLCI